MTPLQAAILGLIQGITEFLPVSSSGHLLIPQFLFGWSEQGVFFDVAVHVATLVAVVYYFRRRIWCLMRAAVSRSASQDRRLAWMIALSVIPVGLVGMSDSLTDWMRATPLVIGLSFIVWGVVLGGADWYSTRIVRPVEQIRRRDIVWMSLAQVLALIPGTSRAGITMTAGLFSGLSKRATAEASFLMSIPVIFAAGAKQLIDMEPLSTIDWGVISIGFLTATISAFGCIWLFLRLIERVGYLPFVVYRVMLGALILILFV